MLNWNTESKKTMGIFIHHRLFDKKIFGFLLSVCAILSTHQSISQDSKQQKITLSGVVTNASNKPLKDIIIYVDSIKTKEKTNKRGEFKIKLSEANKVVSFYSPLHGVGDIAFIGQETINFSFPEGSNFLKQEDLIKIGYREPVKKVYGSGEINFENDPSVLNYTDIFQLIGVRFAGVNVTGETISIRGSATNSMSNSIGGSSSNQRVSQEPLYLVNDSPVSSISAIAPDQVKSIKILTSTESGRYGIRGANGVVSITLKN